MAFPILKYVAFKSEPATAYELERVKHDIMRNGKNEKAWIDKPTIFRALRLLERAGLVRVMEQKVCRDGRVRKRYVVTHRGVVALLEGRWKYVQISKQDIRGLAEAQKSFLPLIFGKWDLFREKGVEYEAILALHRCLRGRRQLIDRLRTAADSPQAVLRPGFSEIAWRHDIYEKVLPPVNLETDRAQRWLNAIHDDKEIMEMALRELQHDLTHVEEELNELKRNIMILRGERPISDWQIGGGMMLNEEGWTEIERWQKEVHSKALEEGSRVPTLEELKTLAIKEGRWPPKSESKDSAIPS
jgi:DNA-binding PadR family transcriptional regulator